MFSCLIKTCLKKKILCVKTILRVLIKTMQKYLVNLLLYLFRALLRHSNETIVDFYIIQYCTHFVKCIRHIFVVQLRLYIIYFRIFFNVHCFNVE